MRPHFSSESRRVRCHARDGLVVQRRVEAVNNDECAEFGERAQVTGLSRRECGAVDESQTPQCARQMADGRCECEAREAWHAGQGDVADARQGWKQRAEVL